MAIKQNNSKGRQTQEQVKLILEVILDFADGQRNDTRKSKPMRCQWNAEKKAFQVNDARVRTIAQEISQEKNTTQIADEAVNRAFGDLEELKIFIDRRGIKTQGASLWQFDLKFQTKERPSILAEFDRLWMEKWNSDKTAPHTKPKFPVKPSPLMHGVPLLPDNYVVRSTKLIAVKAMLLGTTDRSKVSAISGMGGLGKSLLVAKLVQDEEVQRRFEDGILWVTLGQNPESLLHSKLGELIEALDKPGGSFSTTTLDASSRYLHHLLADKRMLLVIDDVWDAHHLKWFRVGGSECRILLTTRFNSLAAINHELKVMSSDEAQMLIKNELQEQWTAEMEKPAREFSKSLGYLPFALQLMAVQVRRGRSWENLRKAFFEERVRLRTLDQPGVKLANLSEEEQRKYSLRACLQLSLRWLEPEQLSNFTWLGVLPEDATIRQGMAMVLWDVADWEAEENLLALYESSLLSRGADTLDGVRTYRVHDLLHTLAKNVIEQPRSIVGNDNLVGLGLSFADAQAQFLERYRGRSNDRSWYELPNDGYIHRHLTWHLEMAGQLDEIHELMASGEDQNDWFEACDKIGEPAVFVQNVTRGWELAEKLHKKDRGQAIVLQCRYALIMGTVHSLFQQMPVELFEAALKHDFLTIEEVWAYVQEIQDDQQFADIILAITSYLNLKIAALILDKVKTIKNESSKADILHEIAKKYSELSQKIVTIAKSFTSKIDYVWILIGVGRHDPESQATAYAESKSIDSPFFHYFISSQLEIDKEIDFEEGVRLSRPKGGSSYGETNLSEKAKTNPDIFQRAWKDSKKLDDLYYAGSSIISILSHEKSLISEAMKLIEKIKKPLIRNKLVSKIDAQNEGLPDSEIDKFSRRDRFVLEYIRKSDLDSISVYFLTYECILNAKNDMQFVQRILNDVTLMSDDLQTGRIQEGTNRAWGLIALAQRSSGISKQIFEVATSLKNDSDKAQVFCELERTLPEYFLDRVLVELGKITHLPTKAKVLSKYISRLPLAALLYSDWKTYLHLLAHRTRADLMGDLATLYPAILHLGGEDAGRGMVGEIGRVCKQWK